MEITLYQFPTCPYCAKVRAYLEEKQLPFTIVDVSTDRADEKRVMMAEKTGVHSVPVAEIDGKWVGDSSVIIEFLENAS